MLSSSMNPTSAQAHYTGVEDAAYNSTGFRRREVNYDPVKQKPKVLTDFEKHVGWLQDVRAAKRNMIT